MTNFFDNSTEILRNWQSSASMIPVALGLLKEQLDHLGEHHKPQTELFQKRIQIYQKLYQHWRTEKNLNPKQQEWIREMGGYLNVLQQTLFHSRIKNSSDQTELNNQTSFEFNGVA
jgi:uncharacterized membrane-anchored protein YhcB (DUF1043 family)